MGKLVDFGCVGHPRNSTATSTVPPGAIALVSDEAHLLNMFLQSLTSPQPLPSHST